VGPAGLQSYLLMPSELVRAMITEMFSLAETFPPYNGDKDP
jgi:hypothetical protein